MTTKDPWWWALLGVIVLVMVIQKFLPRYEWRTVPQTSSISIIIYDRWTGRMQRAVYDDKGGLNVMGVYTPF
jgi:hypothetical protein